MSALATAIVDGRALGRVVLFSLVAGIGVTAAFAIALHGVVRFADMRRQGRAAGAAASALLAVVGGAVVAVSVVLGIVVMTSK